MAIDTTMMISYDVKKKSAGMAYVLLIFLGWFGIHNFYLGRAAIAVTQLVTSVGGLFAIIIGGSLASVEHPQSALGVIGVLCWLVNWLLWTIDLFSLWHFAKQHNARLLASLNKGEITE